MRRKCVGKRVRYVVQRVMNDSNRAYADLFLGTDDEAENLAEAGVAAGYLEVASAARSDEGALLLALQGEAETKKLGR